MKVIKYLLNTLSIFVTFIILAMAILYLLGIVPTIVTSGSMIPNLEVGELCFINTKYPYENVKIGDIIVYIEPRQKVIHRVVEKNENYLRTKGDANEQIDRLKITKNAYYGKYVFSIPKVGFITTSLQNNIGKTIFVTSIIILFVATYLLNYAMKEREKNGNNR